MLKRLTISRTHLGGSRYHSSRIRAANLVRTRRYVLFAILVGFADANDFVRVKRVIDGDTIILESGERVRLIGVDTPETVHPKKPVEKLERKPQRSLYVPLLNLFNRCFYNVYGKMPKTCP